MLNSVLRLFRILLLSLEMNEDVDGELEIMGVITSLTAVIRKTFSKLGKKMSKDKVFFLTYIDGVKAQIKTEI